MLVDIVSQKQRLDSVFARISQIQGDDELRAHWAKYLCVLTSGFIETSMRIILSKYASQKASPPIVNYVEGQIEWVTNLNEDKLAKLLGAFSAGWQKKFTERRTQQQKESVDSVVANRHLIVHGRSVGVTYARVKRYYDDVVEMVRIIDEECVQ